MSLRWFLKAVLKLWTDGVKGAVSQTSVSEFISIKKPCRHWLSNELLYCRFKYVLVPCTCVDVLLCTLIHALNMLWRTQYHTWAPRPSNPYLGTAPLFSSLPEVPFCSRSSVLITILALCPLVFLPLCILNNYSSPFCQVSNVYPEPFEYSITYAPRVPLPTQYSSSTVVAVGL